MTTFAEMMALEPHGPDTLVGAGPRYPWGGLYGGQIVAQGLRAAGLTVDPTYLPHSLHAYFIRPGDHDEPIRFEVDRDRNGRSFCTRRVVARQSVGVILNMACSFQLLEDTVDVQASTMRPVTAAEAIDDDSWSVLFDRHDLPTSDTGSGRSGAWLRLREDLGDDPLVSACALAYLSDDMPTEAVFALHPELAHLRDLSDGVGARPGPDRQPRSRHLVPPTPSRRRLATPRLRTASDSSDHGAWPGDRSSASTASTSPMSTSRCSSGWAAGSSSAMI